MSATSIDYLRAVGQQLREARQQRGEDLYDIAEILCLKPAYLYALEEGDYTVFPGRAYAFGFLRSYADYLGFHGEEVLRQIKAVIDAAPVEPKLEYRTPIIERHRPTAVFLVTAALLMGAAWGGWYAVRQTGGLSLDRISALPGEIGRMVSEFATGGPAEEPPSRHLAAEAEGTEPESSAVPAAKTPVAVVAVERLEAPADTPPVLPRGAVVPAVSTPVAPPAPSAEPERAAATAEDGGTDITSAIAAELPADRELLDTEVAAPVEPASTAPASAAALLAELRAGDAVPSGGRTFGDPATSVVMLRARDTTWIQVRSADRAFVRTRILEPGDRFYLPARDDLALWTGNAGGLEIWLEGRRLGLAGKPGQVVRELPLRRESLERVLIADG